MNLTCVKCTSVLDKARVGDVEVDLCPSCGGLWLDHGEIERLGRGKPDDLTRLRTALIGTTAPDPASETTDVLPGLPRPAQRGRRSGRCTSSTAASATASSSTRASSTRPSRPSSGTTVRQVLTLAGSIAKS